jgi:hypothetical protein
MLFNYLIILKKREKSDLHAISKANMELEYFEHISEYQLAN